MERYPVGECGDLRVEVRRAEHAGEGLAGFSIALAADEASFVVRLPGHYGAELARHIRAAESASSPGAAGARRTYRDEFLDLTVLAGEDGDGELLISSSARVPLRMSMRLAREDLRPLAELLESAHELVETLRRGISLVPDRLPENFAAAD